MIILYGIEGLWSLACEYYIYDKNYFFSNNILFDIIIGFISLILNQIVICIILCLALIPLMCGGFIRNDNKINLDCNICKLISTAIFLIMFGCIYFGCFYTELYIQKVNNTPDLFTIESLKYFECGFLKPLPNLCLFAYVCYHDMMPNFNEKVHGDMKSSNDKISSV